MAAEPGTIVVLNGAAGAGKSSIGREIQKQSPEPYLVAGIDAFLRMLPERWFEGPGWLDVMGSHDRAGDVGQLLVHGMHRAWSELSQAGNQVVADHVMVDPVWVADCARLLGDLPAYFVGVRCALPELERRERERSDRQATIGEAAKQHELVHRHALYDLELDTERCSAAECARAVLAHIAQRPPRAFAELARA